MEMPIQKSFASKTDSKLVGRLRVSASLRFISWITRELLTAIHDRQLAEHGGADGVSDEAAIANLLDEAKRRFADGKSSLTRLAAAYAVWIFVSHSPLPYLRCGLPHTRLHCGPSSLGVAGESGLRKYPWNLIRDNRRREANGPKVFGPSWLHRAASLLFVGVRG
jgi:hypothetical protein